uniref:Uncharacterized protein n=1 Tax=Pristionchus pacificus TaxID=54126 RepID=A0A2A6D0I3_PRIPA|eukprot:PDM83899.1 hypothetical protein PRIPAC_30386 [Pristionchus pacificus]
MSIQCSDRLIFDLCSPMSPEKEGVIVTSDDELPEGLKIKKEPPEEKVIKEERPGLLPVSPSSSEDDEVRRKRNGVVTVAKG